MNEPTNPNQQSVGTQTEEEADISNIAKGRSSIDEERHGPLFQFNEEPTPQPLANLQKVF